MTFNAKKHTETERRWSRDSAGPFIYCTLPERALNAGLCMCDCRLRAHLQNQGHVLLLTKKKMSAVSITGLVFPAVVCVCVGVRWDEVRSPCGVSVATRVRGRRLAVKNRRGGRVDKLEKVCISFTLCERRAIYSRPEIQGHESSLHILMLCLLSVLSRWRVAFVKGLGTPRAWMIPDFWGSLWY